MPMTLLTLASHLHFIFTSCHFAELFWLVPDRSLKLPTMSYLGLASQSPIHFQATNPQYFNHQGTKSFSSTVCLGKAPTRHLAVAQLDYPPILHSSACSSPLIPQSEQSKELQKHCTQSIPQSCRQFQYSAVATSLISMRATLWWR